MKEPIVIYGYPVIFTKDKDWVKQHHVVRPGSIVLLPDDAVLVSLPETDYVVENQDLDTPATI